MNVNAANAVSLRTIVLALDLANVPGPACHRPPARLSRASPLLAFVRREGFAEATGPQPLDTGIRPAALQAEAVVAKVAAQVLTRDAPLLERARVPVQGEAHTCE